MNITIKETYLQFKNALSTRKRTNNIAIHHAAAKSCGAETIHKWHLANGWSGIGYHLVVRKDGTIERGRPIHTVGAHVSNHNSYTVGICFEGNFQEEQMNDVQYKAGAKAIAYVMKLYGLKGNAVKGHKEFMATGCPGQYFPLKEMIADAESLLSKNQKQETSEKVEKETVKETVVTGYTIRKGDTLYKIAKELGTNWEKLAKINGITFPYILRVGQVIKTNISDKLPNTGYNAKVTARSGLNMRKGAGESWFKVGTIPYGTKVYISKEEHGWGYTSYTDKNGKTIEGWVYLLYVKKI